MTVVENYWRWVHGYVVKRVPQTDLWYHDYVQEGLVAIWRRSLRKGIATHDNARERIQSVMGGESMLGSTHKGRAGSVRAFPYPEDEQGNILHEPSYEVDFTSVDIRDEIVAAVDALPPKQREAAINIMLDRPNRGSGRANWHEAKPKLRAALEHLHD